MALSGERKLSVKSRGLSAIAYEIARVGTTQINHLVSQTEGEFQNPDFRSDSFDEENISRISEEKQPLALTSRFTANYSTFNFAPELGVPSDGGSERGLFFLKARAWDPVNKKYLDEVSDHRFILITDLGLIAKENADGTRDVFVASIKNGAPVAGATVEVLGKNGVPLVSKLTDPEGHTPLPSFDDYQRDQRPVAYVVRLGNDVSFLPYDRDNRRLNFSRFDVGGVQSNSGADLDAFLFTERGVYLPGDPIHVGYIVKRRDWQAVNGLPLEMQIVDARGQIMEKRRVVLPAGGFGEYTVQTEVTSPTGTWEMHLYLVKNRDDLEELGSTTAWVKEFLPDRMKIVSTLSKSTAGWVTPEQLQAAITLQNLYGAPAPERRVKGHLNLSPTAFSFADYPGYRFYDRLLEKEAHPKLQEVDLDDETTDAQGRAQFDLELDRYANATYALSFYAEGFEADGGRSVNTQSDVLVSPLPYLVGNQADGDLSYIAAGAARGVHFIAINPALKQIALGGLHFRLVEHTYVSVLTKRPNGNFEYESVERDREVRNETRDLPGSGLPFALDVTNPGDFVLEVLDAQGARLSAVNYTVVGKGAGARSLDRDAELQIKLPKHDYAAGETLEVAITAPYTGSGLITIERDKVYAHAWFKADTTSSVQHVQLPADFEGTAYVNVTFVRGLDSREVFTSPLSYAVEAVTVNREKRHLGLTLQAATQAKPGEPLHIHYHTDRPARIALYAVDQGILQVSDYTLPDPLAEFFKKTELAVGTSQILDLILPEFSILRAVSATGGGEDMLAKNLNPFQRVTEKPVVYWSGIVDADATDREVIYNVPDFFDGTLKVMAVAYAPDATGSAEQSSLIRDRFVITPSAPTVAAPGDTFVVGVTVANGGKETDVQLAALASEQLQIVKSPAQPLHLAKNAETTVEFTVKATSTLGSGRLQFTASGDGEESRRSATLSVRPPVPYMTQVRGEASQAIISICRWSGRCSRNIASSMPPSPRSRSGSQAGSMPTCTAIPTAARSRSRAARSAGSCSPGRLISASPTTRSRNSLSTSMRSSARARTTRAASATGRRKTRKASTSSRSM
ncbi:MAG: MG2 domain-containing protein [Chthoniobacteraceae bacterium]